MLKAHQLLCARAGRVLAALLSLACNVAAAQGSSGCRPPDTVSVPTHLQYLTRFLVCTDSLAVGFRDAFKLQPTTANKIALVTKNATCLAAASALNAIAGTPTAVRQVWVYTLGNNYAVEDPSIADEPDPGEYPIHFFDRQWRPKPVLMY